MTDGELRFYCRTWFWMDSSNFRRVLRRVSVRHEWSSPSGRSLPQPGDLHTGLAALVTSLLSSPAACRF
jgi:hypothetical protein